MKKKYVAPKVKAYKIQSQSLLNFSVYDDTVDAMYSKGNSGGLSIWDKEETTSSSIWDKPAKQETEEDNL